MPWELIGLYFITKSTCLWDEDFKRTIFPWLVKTTIGQTKHGIDQKNKNKWTKQQLDKPTKQYYRQ